MASGRVLRSSISTDPRVAQLSDASALLFTWALAHADAEGRLLGDPGAVRDLVVPLRPWTVDDIAALIAEWEQTIEPLTGLPRPLVIRYQVDDCHVVAFTGWVKNQPRHFRRARGALPPPPAALPHSGNAAQRSGGNAATAALSVPARAPGLDHQPSEGVVVQSSSSSLANHERDGLTARRTAATSAAWLDETFAEVFGRLPRPSRREQITELVELGAQVGRGTVRDLMRDRQALNPQALAYFLTPLRELASAATREPAVGVRPPVVCASCGVGGGLHLDGCDLFVRPSPGAEEVRLITPALRGMDAA